MAFSEQLATRIRHTLEGQAGWEERKMFGGLCFTWRGHMCCGIVGDNLMLRMGEERAQASLQRPHTREMDFTGRPLKGLIYVEPKGITTSKALRSWIALAQDFIRTLPSKRRIPKSTPRVNSGSQSR